jgi:hypothetical protein
MNWALPIIARLSNSTKPMSKDRILVEAEESIKHIAERGRTTTKFIFPYPNTTTVTGNYRVTIDQRETLNGGLHPLVTSYMTMKLFD